MSTVATKYPVRDILEDFVLLNEAFARCFSISWKESFNYLKQYGGLSYYERNYGYEHTQSYESTVDALREVCRRNGGTL